MIDGIPIDLALALYRVAAGSEPHVRDMGALSSSLARPYTEFAGIAFYPTLHQRAAALLESINRNHPLVDGNKRLSFILVLALYAAHDATPRNMPSAPAVDRFIRSVAEGSTSFEEITQWLSDVFGADATRQ